MFKKIVSVFMAAIMAVSGIAVNIDIALAGEAEKEVVYTSFTSDNTVSRGDGTLSNPYNLFKDAVKNVKDGGTIYIKGEKGAFLNVESDYDRDPYLIDKNITVKPAPGMDNAQLLVRKSGIKLGADVTFER